MLFQIYGDKAGYQQKKNPYKNEIFTDTRDFRLAMERAE